MCTLDNWEAGPISDPKFEPYGSGRGKVDAKLSLSIHCRAMVRGKPDPETSRREREDRAGFFRQEPAATSSERKVGIRISITVVYQTRRIAADEEINLPSPDGLKTNVDTVTETSTEDSHKSGTSSLIAYRRNRDLVPDVRTDPYLALCGYDRKNNQDAKRHGLKRKNPVSRQEPLTSRSSHH